MSLFAKPLISKDIVISHVTESGALSSCRVRRAEMQGDGSDVSVLEGAYSPNVSGVGSTHVIG